MRPRKKSQTNPEPKTKAAMRRKLGEVVKPLGIALMTGTKGTSITKRPMVLEARHRFEPVIAKA